MYILQGAMKSTKSKEKNFTLKQQNKTEIKKKCYQYFIDLPTLTINN